MEAQAPPFLIDPEELKQKLAAAEDVIKLPAAAVEALDLANDPECSIPSFVQVIEADTGLVADILSMSNSSSYGARQSITSVQQAVVSIGMKQCQNLIISSCVKALSQKLPPSVEWSRDVLWQHNTQAATVARFLNKALKLKFDGEEFSGAMIHDVGRLLVAAAAPDVFDTVDRLSFCESSATPEKERTLIGTDHCEIGADFAENNRLPQALVDVVRHHHNPDDAGDNATLVHLIAAADHIANHYMYAGNSDGYDWESNLSLAGLADSNGANLKTVADEALQLLEERNVEK